MSPLDYSVRMPMGLGEMWSWIGRVCGRDVVRPICVRNIWPASVRRRQSRASVADRLARSDLEELDCPDLCCDDVKLEFLPVFVGLFERLNLYQISEN